MDLGDITGWNYIMDGLNFIASFFNTTVYELLVEFGSWLVVKLTIGTIAFTIGAMQYSWDVAQQILIDLNLSTLLNNAWAALPGETVSTLTFFGIPEVVNILLSSFVTRWVMRFIPFL